MAAGLTSVVVGVTWLAAALLALAGARKVRAPGPTVEAVRTAGLPGSAPAVRVLGSVEVVVAGAVLLHGGRVGAVALCLLYLSFAGFLLRLRAHGGAGVSCHCLGAARSPVGRSHVVVDAAVVVVAAMAAAGPVPPVVPLSGGLPTWVAPTTLATLVVLALTTALAQTALTDLPVLRERTRRLQGPRSVP
jgi:hypothetical protein